MSVPSSSEQPQPQEQLEATTANRMEDTNNDNSNNSNSKVSSNGTTPKGDNETKEPPSKKFRATEDIDLRFLISSKEAGAIIGKGGVNINHLRKTYKSSVTIPDCPGPERVLSIILSLDKLHDFMMDMLGYLDDKSNDKEVELRLLIHTSIAGGIIGKAGQKIRELREQTKAAIKVFSQCCPNSTERICAIHGTPTVVTNATKVILDIILSTPLKGVVKLYDPRNCDPFTHNPADYGGITDPTLVGAYRNLARVSGTMATTGRSLAEPWERNPLQVPLTDLTGASVDPKSWSQANQYQYAAALGADPATTGTVSTSSDLYQRWVNPAFAGQAMIPTADGTPYWSDVMPGQDKSGQGSALNHGLTMPMIPHMQSWLPNPYTDMNKGVADSEPLLMENPDGSSSASITVQNKVAGAIIGKGGNRISLVRRESGASVSIEASGTNSKDRIITIKGTPIQVRAAYKMLQRRIQQVLSYDPTDTVR